MGLTKRVDRMNEQLDGFLLAVSPLALKLGLIVGTVSLLLGGSLAQNGYFQWVWAIIQAMSVDSVFLITARVFWIARWKSLDKLLFGLLTLMYGAVGFLALNVVSFQELRASSLAVAMSALNIDLGLFTTLRSVVIMATIALFYLIRKRAKQLVETPMIQVETKIETVETPQISIPGSNEYQLSHRVSQGVPLIPEHLTPVSLDETMRQPFETMRQDETVVETTLRQVETNETSMRQPDGTMRQNETPSETVRRLNETGMSVPEIVRQTGISRATVYRLLK